MVLLLCLICSTLTQGRVIYSRTGYNISFPLGQEVPEKMGKTEQKVSTAVGAHHGHCFLIIPVMPFANSFKLCHFLNAGGNSARVQLLTMTG